jgi:hypothetical protein
MIRPFTCLCLVAACGSGLYLYSEKHRTAMLDRDIGQVIRQTEAARAQTGMLRAEWALLNEPGRLQDMAEKYLSLKTMAPTQFVQVSDLSAHLPAPLAPAPAGATDQDDTTPVASVVAPAPPADLAETAAAKTQAPAASATQDAGAISPPKLLAHAEIRPHAQPHHVAVADRQDVPHDGLLAHGTPLPLAAPQPMGASVYSAMARPLRQQPVREPPVRPSIIAALPTYARATPMVGSVLGTHAALPPPIPYGQ